MISMFEHAAGWVSHEFGGWLGGPTFMGVTTGRWAGLAIAAATGWAVGRAAAGPARLVLRRLRHRIPSVAWADNVEHRLTAPVGLLVTVAAVRAGVEVLGFPPAVGGDVRTGCNFALAVVATLLAVRLVGVGKEYLQAVLVGRARDPGRVRLITTRVTVPARILQFLLWAAGTALALLQFRAVQEVGVSLLASAGVAGVVLGLAAQRTVGNLFAGLQLAFAEPLRIGDSVSAEGEFGVVEEINLTHVVIRVWDLHRLILPVSYFVEKPFQNWSHGSSEVIGAVLVRTDFSVPVSEIREELRKALADTDLWDGKTGTLQVTELSGDRVELRALVSAADNGRLGDLQCHVRERLLTWLQSRGRAHLPVQRVEAVGNGYQPPPVRKD
ncbi:MAG TPA: mechanosensitive ion channel domain-containing protein [Urbifossiella sp.]|jgi:small-conductance mechanosensitive channel|nr:mechanosensitive ion channel domain-containing protein [Urbifossiella sp.]